MTLYRLVQEIRAHKILRIDTRRIFIVLLQSLYRIRYTSGSPCSFQQRVPNKIIEIATGEVIEIAWVAIGVHSEEIDVLVVVIVHGLYSWFHAIGVDRDVVSIDNDVDVDH